MPATAQPSPVRPGAATRPRTGSSRPWVITGMITVFMMINFADKSVLGLSAVPIMHQFHLSDSSYGLLASSFFLLFGVSGVAAGFVSRRVASRWVLFALAVGWAVAQLPLLFAATVPSLVVGRVLLGAAEGPASPLSMHALYDWFPADRRSLPSALQVAGGGVGTFLAAPVLTWIITNHGWRSAFLALAVGAALWAALWLCIGGDGPRATAPVPAAASPKIPAAASAAVSASPGGLQLRTLRPLLTSGTVLGGLAAAFGAYWALTVGSAWLPAYLHARTGESPATAATVVSLGAALNVTLILTVVPYTGRLMRRGVSSRWALGLLQGLTVLVSGACMAAFPFVSSGALRTVLITVAFGAAGLTFPLSYLTAAEIVPPQHRGTVFAISTAISTLPGIIAPATTGALIDHFGYRTAFTTAGVLMLLAGAYAAFAIRPQHDRDRLIQPRPGNSRPAQLEADQAP